MKICSLALILFQITYLSSVLSIQTTVIEEGPTTVTTSSIIDVPPQYMMPPTGRSISFWVKFNFLIEDPTLSGPGPDRCIQVFKYYYSETEASWICFTYFNSTNNKIGFIPNDSNNGIGWIPQANITENTVQGILRDYWIFFYSIDDGNIIKYGYWSYINSQEHHVEFVHDRSLVSNNFTDPAALNSKVQLGIHYIEVDDSNQRSTTNLSVTYSDMKLIDGIVQKFEVLMINTKSMPAKPLLRDQFDPRFNYRSSYKGVNRYFISPVVNDAGYDLTLIPNGYLYYEFAAERLPETLSIYFRFYRPDLTGYTIPLISLAYPDVTLPSGYHSFLSLHYSKNIDKYTLTFFDITDQSQQISLPFNESQLIWISVAKSKYEDQWIIEWVINQGSDQIINILKTPITPTNDISERKGYLRVYLGADPGTAQFNTTQTTNENLQISQFYIFEDGIDPTLETIGDIIGHIQLQNLNQAFSSYHCQTYMSQFACLANNTCGDTAFCEKWKYCPSCLGQGFESSPCALCGNGNVTWYEECDTGSNQIGNGTCSPTCAAVPSCYSQTVYTGNVSADWSYIDVTFPAPMTSDIELTCDGFFDFSQFGEGATCQFNSSTQFVITLGSNPELMSSQTFLIKHGSIRAEDCRYSPEGFEVEIIGTNHIPQFQLGVSQPSNHIDSCQDTTISIDSLIGDFGFDPISVIWMPISSLQGNHSAHAALNQTAQLFQDSTQLVLSKSLLLTLVDSTLNLTADYTNFLQNSAQKEINLIVYPVFDFDLVITNTQAIENQQIVLRATLLSQCLPEDVFFMWDLNVYLENGTVYKMLNVQEYGLENADQDFIIMPNVLSAGNIYNISLTVAVGDGVEAPAVTLERYISFEVFPAIEVSISADLQSAHLDYRRSLKLNALVESNIQGAIEISWTCSRVGSGFPCVDQHTQQELAFENSEENYFRGYTFEPDQSYLISVEVIQNGEFQSAEITIPAVTSESPIAYVSYTGIHESQIVKEVPIINLEKQGIEIIAELESNDENSLEIGWTFEDDQIQQNSVISSDSSSVLIPKKYLNEGDTIQFSLSLEDLNGVFDQDYSFVVNSKPSGGTISSSNIEGEAFSTSFVLSTDGWVSGMPPLTYRFGYYEDSDHVGLESQFVIVGDYQQEEAFIEGVMLPNPKNGQGTFLLAVKAIDSIGLESEDAIIEVSVSKNEPATLDQIKEFLDENLKDEYQDEEMALRITKLAASYMMSFNGEIEEEEDIEEFNGFKDRILSNMTLNLIGEKKSSLMVQAVGVLNELAGEQIEDIQDSVQDLFLDYLSEQLIFSAGEEEEREKLISYMDNLVVQEISKAVSLIIEYKNEAFKESTDDEAKTLIKEKINQGIELLESLSIYASVLIGGLDEDDEININNSRLNMIIRKGDIENGDEFIVDYEDQAEHQQFITFNGYSEVGSSNIVSVFKQWKEDPFEGLNENSNITVVSDILSLSLLDSTNGQEIDVTDLENKVKISFVVNNTVENLSLLNCRYWDIQKKLWSTNGCEKTNTTALEKTLNRVECECSHLTDFSVTNDVEELFANSALNNFDDFHALDNFSFEKVKITYVLIGLSTFMVLFFIWGYYHDKARKSYVQDQNSQEILDIGLQEYLKRVAQMEKTKGNLGSIDEVDNHDPLKKKKGKRMSIKKKRKSIRKKSLNSDPSKPKLKGKRTSRMQIRKLGLEPSQIQIQSQKEPINKHQRISFCKQFIHAIRTCHNLLSVFMLYVPTLSRPCRFLLYFLRWFGIVLTTATFLRSRMEEGGLSVVQIVIISLISMAIVLPFHLLLIWLFRAKLANSTHTIAQKKEIKTNNRVRFIIGSIIALAYFTMSSIFTIIIGIQNDDDFNFYLFIFFFIQLGQDLFVNQVLKAFISTVLIRYLKSGHASPTTRKILMSILDHNLFIGFQ